MAKDEKTKVEKPQETVVASTVPRAILASAATEGPHVEAPEPIGLDQIREILFGAIFRELERRLVRADLHLGSRTKEIEQEARRRTEVLEAHLRTEIAALAARVERAFVESAEALRGVGRESREAMSALEKRISKTEEFSASAQRELRNQMLDQAKSFLDELQHVRKELLAQMKAELEVPESMLVEERGEVEEHPRH
jgi:hypothetical protein